MATLPALHLSNWSTSPRSEESKQRTGRAPLCLGLIAELHGHTVHADVCRAVLDHVPTVSDDPPHPELNMNHPEAGTVLHWALQQRLRDAALAVVACRHFLLVNARLPQDGSTALHVAAAEGMSEVVATLLGRPDFASSGAVDRDGFTALHGAAFRGHASCVWLLLDCPKFGAPGVPGAFDVARPNGHWAKEACTDYDMNTALHMAASRNHAEICDMILTKVPSSVGYFDLANRMGATALHMAARSSHTDACAAILRHTTKFTAVNLHDARGFTALHWAAHQANGDIADIILKREDFTNIAVERRDLRGRTAADIAQELGHCEVRRLILKRLGTLALGREDY